jgi:hypothetical protein
MDRKGLVVCVHCFSSYKLTSSSPREQLPRNLALAAGWGKNQSGHCGEETVLLNIHINKYLWNILYVLIVSPQVKEGSEGYHLDFL